MFTLGGKCVIIRLDELYALIFSLVDMNQKADMLPIRQTQIRKYIKQHRVKVGKNLQKGDEMVVNCEIDVPLTVTEGLRREVIKNKSIFAI